MHLLNQENIEYISSTSLFLKSLHRSSQLKGQSDIEELLQLPATLHVHSKAIMLAYIAKKMNKETMYMLLFYFATSY